MKKNFSLSNDKVTINFTAKYCASFESILNSEGFDRIIEEYLRKIEKKKTNSFKFLVSASKTEDVSIIKKYLISTVRLLTMIGAEGVVNFNEHFQFLVDDKENMLNVIEEIYSFWRRLERYTLIHNNRVKEGIAAVSFTEANAEFSKLILSFYRRIEKNLLGKTPTVYRQLPAGGNACIMLGDIEWPVPEEYKILKDVPFIDAISLETPFITYPKKNTRDGMFKETLKNPLNNIDINEDHWFCYPAKVGELLAYVYFHRDFMSHGITLCNLFELAREEEYINKKPDIVYVFGAKEEGDLKTVFYDDTKNDIMVGYVNHSEEIDYFGYMKKMILTLHNLIMIKRGFLPIHGAMVNIVLKNGKKANVVIMGDSGAGKSESLEAFRSLSEDYVSDMTIVFDDMGTIKLKEDGIYGYGTEIGAFVRLDDLDQGYAFKEMDRSIFMNPDKINARLVMPVASYAEIMAGYKVDLFLYANNYENADDKDKSITYFDNVKEAIDVFRSGARMAKGTTTENGLVKSYFANPFGPAQKEEETDKLLDTFFNKMFESKVKVGQIKTCLAVKGCEKNGPRKAALELFDIIKNI